MFTPYMLSESWFTLCEVSIQYKFSEENCSPSLNFSNNSEILTFFNLKAWQSYEITTTLKLKFFARKVSDEKTQPCLFSAWLCKTPHEHQGDTESNTTVKNTNIKHRTGEALSYTVQESPSTVYTAFCRFEFIAWARRPHYVTSSDQGRGHDVALFNALNIFALVARWEGEC